MCLSSTPMARQMAVDMIKMSQLSEEVGEWYAQRTSDVAIFTPGCWERVRFLEFPVKELREAKMAYCFPESEQEETEVLDVPVMLKRQVSAVQLFRLLGPFIPASWPMQLRPRLSSKSAGACSELVLLVIMQFLVTGPRSSASWSVWTGREVDIDSCMFTAGFAGDHAICAVFLVIGGRP